MNPTDPSTHPSDELDPATLDPADPDPAALSESSLQDLPALTLVRPELFIHPTVIGLSVPQTTVRGGRVIGAWRTYLRHQENDRRESRTLDARMDIGPTTFWVHPLPPAPSPVQGVHWSPQAQQAWLEGRDVNALEVFNRLCALLDAHVDVGQDQRDEGGRMKDETEAGLIHPSSFNPHPSPYPAIATLALWTLFTYIYPAWNAAPYLFITGCAGSGKTRVFEVLLRLIFRPLASSSLSAAALFRTLHNHGGTLLLDEAERLSESGDDLAELRSILLAGYKRGGRATRLEPCGPNFRTVEFSVYGPKAIAAINSIPPSLASRCIPLTMLRATPDSPRPRRRLDADPQSWQSMRDDLHALALGELGKSALRLAHDDQACPLSGRAHELWHPLLAMARWLDQQRPDCSPALHPHLLEWARTVSDSGNEALVPEVDELLLRALVYKRDRPATCGELLDSVRRGNPEPVRGLSQRRVAQILKRYGLTTVRYAGRSIFRDYREQLRQIELRYGLNLQVDAPPRIVVLPIQHDPKCG